MPWDEKDNNNNKGPWGQSPSGKNQGKNESNPNKPDSNAEIEQIIKNGQEKLRKFVNNSNSGRNGNNSNKLPPIPEKIMNRMVFGLVALIAFFTWILSGVYIVDTKEAGVVLRFGKYIRTSQPGLNYHLPYPIENVVKLSVTDRYRTEVGVAGEKARTNRGAKELRYGDDLLMLTGDENLVDVNFEVQWQIDNAEKFLFNVYDPQNTARNAAESAMREMIGTSELSDILSEGRTVIQQKTKELLQNTLDSYDAGIKIEAINMRGVPPTSAITVENIVTGEGDGEIKSETVNTTVDEAFKDVQAAIINKEEIINMAIARGNEVIPEARGQAQKLIQDAQGYKEQVIAKAQGDANRFSAVYNEYKNAKDVTRKRIYLETMEQVLEGMDKVFINSKSGVVPYLPLKELGSKANDNR